MTTRFGRFGGWSAPAADHAPNPVARSAKIAPASRTAVLFPRCCSFVVGIDLVSPHGCDGNQGGVKEDLPVGRTQPRPPSPAQRCSSSDGPQRILTISNSCVHRRRFAMTSWVREGCSKVLRGSGGEARGAEAKPVPRWRYAETFGFPHIEGWLLMPGAFEIRTPAEDPTATFPGYTSPQLRISFRQCWERPPSLQVVRD